MTTGERWPLVGRREELALVTEALASESVSGVVLAGRPGVGKTRLAREALGPAEELGYAPHWAAASRAAAMIPLAAFAHLLPNHQDADGFRLLQEAMDRLASVAGDRRSLLAIDDAHLLDAASAALVHQLAAGGEVFILATVRTGEPAPDAVTAIWKDGLASRLELQPLSRAEAAELVVTALGDQVDGFAQHELWRLSRGNALYLRELVRGGLDHGRLTRSEGIWRLQGPVTAPPRLLELVHERIGELVASQRQLLELVAFGEPLELEILQAAGVGFDDLEEAERAGLVVTEATGSSLVVGLGHPLYGEVVRAGSPPLRARGVHHRLADALASTGVPRPGDTLRLAAWWLAAGDPGEPELVLAAAQRAAAAADYELSERLARAAMSSGAGFEAMHALAGALVGQGRAEEAEAILVKAAAAAQSDTQRAAVASTRALNLHWGLARPVEAENVLVSAEAAIADPSRRGELAVLRAKILLYAATRGAEEALADVLSRAGIGDRILASAQAVNCQVLNAKGRYSEAIAVAERSLNRGLAERDPAWSLAEDELARAQCGAYLWSGDLDRAEIVARERYRRALEARWPLNTAAWASLLAMIAGARGAAGPALDWAREAAAITRAHVQLHPYQAFTVPAILGVLARTAAISGEVTEADSALAEADALARPSLRMLNTWGGPPRPWVAAASGDLAAAVRLALAAAEQAMNAGQAGFELIALHDAARLGAQTGVVDRVHELVASVEGRLAPLCALHIAALADGDGAELDRVARSFAALGFAPLAAEAAGAASHAHAETGRRSSALASAARARRWSTGSERAPAPALRELDEPSGLTARELEVARLAAAGMSSRQIADRLTVSVRTVDNALGRVYAKLELAGRNELADVLGLPDEPAPSRPAE